MQACPWFKSALAFSKQLRILKGEDVQRGKAFLIIFHKDGFSGASSFLLSSTLLYCCSPSSAEPKLVVTNNNIVQRISKTADEQVFFLLSFNSIAESCIHDVLGSYKNLSIYDGVSFHDVSQFVDTCLDADWRSGEASRRGAGRWLVCLVGSYVRLKRVGQALSKL